MEKFSASSAIASIRGRPEVIERLVRLHYALSLRELQGSQPDVRIRGVLQRIETALKTKRAAVYDWAPLKNISRVKKSSYSRQELRRAAQSLVELLTPVANGQLPGRDEQVAIAGALKGIGLTPRDAWVFVVLREIERERRDMVRSKVTGNESNELSRRAQLVLEQLRHELGAELPSHVGLTLLAAVLRTYAFHSGGGRRDAVVGRRRALHILRSAKPGNGPASTPVHKSWPTPQRASFPLDDT